MRSPRLLLLLVLLLSGCGTTFQAIHDGPALFGGVRVDAHVVGACVDGLADEDGGRFLKGLGFGLLVAFDLPLSLMADLVLLPVSVPNELINDVELYPARFRAK